MAKVLYNEKILPFYYKLGMSWEGLPAIEPGQFVMLRITENAAPLLRRPFGIYKILGQGASLPVRGRTQTGGKGQGVEIIYKVVGKGTGLMTNLKPGDIVDVLGPLGNSFQPIGRVGAARQNQRIIMAAGGIGIVPFYLLAKSYQLSGISLKLLFGGRGKDDLPGLEDFKKLGIEIKISTQDGSAGEKGLVTELLKSEIRNPKSEIIYACGAKAMLKAVAKMAEDANTPCYVSLDNAMACGIGACLGCAVKIGSGKWEVESGESKPTSHLLPPTSQIYKMVCKDGPVFNAREIAWEEI
ncbi:MAG: dihydroorotate dehydrogenase electron transfer subunit [Deltaproteobacteria bacterium]|nr:dihydroorotate dehydrogenase electron transfer subunit [Deltaproteobacteria bacterium]